ncbi:hypothetical protein J4228_02745 [Candidatus Woesearchaeota archaeon]|nr:hypothetical protein [Candidatus Woesearchaeota archaeon]
MGIKTNRLKAPAWERFSDFSEDEIRKGDFYSQRIRALLVEDGALEPEEEGFMEGYEEGLYEFNEEEGIF